MNTTLQQSYLLVGPPSCGKDALPDFFRKIGARIHLFGLGKHLRELYERGNTNGILAYDLMKKREILSDDLVHYVISEEIPKIGNALPLFLSGIPRRTSQIEMIMKILAANGFARPTIIHFDYSADYCIGRKSRGIEDGTRKARSDDSAFKKGLDDYYASKDEILAECREKGLKIYTISDGEKKDHLEKYARDLCLDLNPKPVFSKRTVKG